MPLDIGLVIDFLSLLISAYLAFVALQFTAKPKIQITFNGEKNTRRTLFKPREEVQLEFEFNNIGYWYAKPAAIETTFYLNFEPEFELNSANYGSALEKTTDTVGIGKGGYKYLMIKGMQLFHQEPGEQIIVQAITPQKPGPYKIRVASMSTGGDHGVQFFQIGITDK